MPGWIRLQIGLIYINSRHLHSPNSKAQILGYSFALHRHPGARQRNYRNLEVNKPAKNVHAVALSCYDCSNERWPQSPRSIAGELSCAAHPGIAPRGTPPRVLVSDVLLFRAGESDTKDAGPQAGQAVRTIAAAPRIAAARPQRHCRLVTIFNFWHAAGLAGRRASSVPVSGCFFLKQILPRGPGFCVPGREEWRVMDNTMKMGALKNDAVFPAELASAVRKRRP